MFKVSVLCLLLGIPQYMDAQATSDIFTQSTGAIEYKVGSKTKVDFKGTSLMPQAVGSAKVETKAGAAGIEAKFERLGEVRVFGAEFLSYVVWAVSPEGKAFNLGELPVDSNGNTKVKISVPMDRFSLLVTAEPYFAVVMPSELVVLENHLRKDTKGQPFVIDNFQMVKKGRYQKRSSPLAAALDLETQPLEIYEARNAVAIARANAADRYAPEIFVKAVFNLQIAENALRMDADRAQVISTAKAAVQLSQDALTLGMEKQEQERVENEQKARQDAERRARAQAEQEVADRAQAEKEAAARQAQAEQDKMKPQASTQAVSPPPPAPVEPQRPPVEAARVYTEQSAALRTEAFSRDAEIQRLQVLATKLEAERLIAQAQAEAAQIRADLLNRFRTVLRTVDSNRGLVISLSDVLFDSGAFTLRPLAKEKLAKIAGIVLNYPKLTLEAEGHTDNVGSAEINQALSEQRANAVKDYLLSQGLPAAAITSVGRGFSVPAASNDTVEGRQQNRRVELIVAGAIIGTPVSDLK